MRKPVRWTATWIKDWDVTERCFDGSWKPARPICVGGMAILQRIKLAFLVFIGRYDVLDWEDDDGGTT